MIQDWTSYDAAHADWEINPHKYAGEPCIPRYKKRAEQGRSETTWEKTAIHKGIYRRQGQISLSGCQVLIETGEHIYQRIRELEALDEQSPVNLYNYLAEVRVVPRATYYEVEIVYRVNPVANANLDQTALLVLI